MYKATLFVLDKEYPLLALNCNFNQKADQTGRPIGRTFGGKLFVKFASTRDDAFFYEAMRIELGLVGGNFSLTNEPFSIPSPAPYLTAVIGINNPFDCD